jgi:hypothetical protein
LVLFGFLVGKLIKSVDCVDEVTLPRRLPHWLRLSVPLPPVLLVQR